MQGTIGEVRLFAGTFAPRDWAFCTGQLMSIAQNSALFAIIGTFYGGDGRTSFGLPWMRGRTAMGYGTGPGLSPNYLGLRLGQEDGHLLTSQMPAHHHTATFISTGASAPGGTTSGTSNVTITPVALNDEGDQNSPTGNVPAKFTPSGGSAYGEYDAGSPSDYTDMHPLTSTFSENLPVSITNVAADGIVTIGNTGNNIPFNITQPSLVLNYIICTDGLFPSRN